MVAGRFLQPGRALVRSVIAVACVIGDATAQEAITGNLASTATVPGFTFRMPDEDRIVYHGMVDRDRAGLGAQAFLYPATGLVGLAAAVITHGIVVNATRDKLQARLKAEADELAAPYVDSAADFRYRDLLAASFERMSTSGGKTLAGAEGVTSSRWLVDHRPVFLISRDQRAVVLESHVTIHATDRPDRPLYENVLRVVSAPAPPDDPLQYWTGEHGLKLRETTAALMAEALDIAIAQSTASASTATTPRTIRYQEGGVERFERGEVLGEGCGRVLVRTLRGWIMSAPTRARIDPPCGLADGSAPLTRVVSSERP